MIVTEDLLLLKAAANSLTGLRSGESGNVGCVMTAAAAGGEVMPATAGRQLLGGAPAPEEEERDTECVRLRECWVAAAGEIGVCAASRACKGWEVPPLEMMAAAVAARGGEGRLPAGLEPGLCSLAEPPHPQGQLVIREAAGLLLLY